MRDNSLSGAELVVGSHARVEGDLLADRIEIASHAAVVGAVSGNSFAVHKMAELSQAPSSPLALPLADVTPATPSAAPGTLDVTVPAGKTTTLGAGAYRAVLVSSGQATRLELSGGLYELSSLELGQQARLYCLAPCELRIAGSLTLADHARLAPVAGMAPTAITISVDGGQQGVQVKPHAELAAQLVARNTGFTLGVLRGNVIATTVTIGPHAILQSSTDAVDQGLHAGGAAMTRAALLLSLLPSLLSSSAVAVTGARARTAAATHASRIEYTLEENKRYFFLVEAFPASDPRDSVLHLWYNAEGKEVAQNDDFGTSGNGLASLIDYTVPAGKGGKTLIARAFGDGTEGSCTIAHYRAPSLISLSRIEAHCGGRHELACGVEAKSWIHATIKRDGATDPFLYLLVREGGSVQISPIRAGSRSIE